MEYGTPIWRGADAVETRYANCFQIGHNVFEIVVHCGQMTDNEESPQCSARIIMNPRSAKALQQVLKRTLDDYETTFGVISYGTEE